MTQNPNQKVSRPKYLLYYISFWLKCVATIYQKISIFSNDSQKYSKNHKNVNMGNFAVVDIM